MALEALAFDQGVEKQKFLQELTDQCLKECGEQDAKEPAAQLSVENAASLIYNNDLSVSQYQVT